MYSPSLRVTVFFFCINAVKRLGVLCHCLNISLTMNVLCQLSAAKINVDQIQVTQLVEMGFPHNACIKAVYFTKNAGIEEAMNWVMAHMDDLGKISLKSTESVSSHSSFIPI